MSDQPRERAVLLFVARVPTPGTAKTRLGATIGMEPAAALYGAFLADIAARFHPAAADRADHDLGWAFSPPDGAFGEALAGLGHPVPPGVALVPQQGDGLARRLEHLFEWAAATGYARCVIVATDSPHLPRRTAADAVAALAAHDLVLGRTADGGYYLIGLRGVHPVLAGAQLSTGGEADALVARGRALGLRVAELPPTFDVDTAEDLRLLTAALAPDGAPAPATWAMLRRLGLHREPPGM